VVATAGGRAADPLARRTVEMMNLPHHPSLQKAMADPVEPVHLRVETSQSVVTGDLTPDERAVFAQQPGRGRVALRLDVARVVAEIGEEEGAGGGRRLAP